MRPFLLIVCSDIKAQKKCAASQKLTIAGVSARGAQPTGDAIHRKRSGVRKAGLLRQRDKFIHFRDLSFFSDHGSFLKK